MFTHTFMFTLILGNVLSICCACALYISYFRERVGNVLLVPCMSDIKATLTLTLTFQSRCGGGWTPNSAFPQAAVVSTWNYPRVGDPTQSVRFIMSENTPVSLAAAQ